MTMPESLSEAPERSVIELPHPTRPNWHWRIIQVILQMFFAIWLRYRARGLENIPESGGGLMLVNHQSFLDPLLVGLPLTRPVSFLARENLFRVPITGYVLRNTYVMPISRDAASTASIRGAIARIRHGFLVGIFPEGTRGLTHEVGEFKPGFIALIRRGKAPVYPVGIAGSRDALPRHALFLRPRPVRVVFGEPIPFETLEPLLKPGREEELVSLARARVAACQQQAEDWLRGR